MELTRALPSSKSDHLALGVKRAWGCLCDLPNFPCPYHLAVQHLAWLRLQPFFVDQPYMPMAPTTVGAHPNKVAVVDTFEAIGDLLGQPLTSVDGLRLFGGHTPRVIGAQTFAAMGIEVNKIRILARHSGDTILRYVVEAPLRSLRADLGLVPRPWRRVFI